jgi:hypothetical protein
MTTPFSWRDRWRQLTPAWLDRFLRVPTRPCVNVNAETYAVISAYARAKGTTNKAFVESLLADLPRPSWMQKRRAV